MLGEHQLKVAPEFVLQAVFLGPGKGPVGLGDAHADDLGAEGVELMVSVAVPATLFFSAVGPAGGEEPECDGAAFQEVGGAQESVLIGDAEFRESERL